MNIPSLFMIPSAVSSGKVHSVFPNSTDADFDFNRDSSATRVNSQGLIEEVGYFGSELVTNGSFDADSNWSKGTGWSIANGKASKVAGSAAELTQASVFPSGFLSKTFRITFTLEVTAGSVRLRAGTNSQSYLNSSGTYSYTLTPAGNDQLKFDANSSFAGSVDNVSCKEVTGDRARLNYEIEGGLVNTKPSLLLEPQSTNLITYSQDISNSYWSNSNSTSISNTAIAPDGTLTADELVDNTSNGYHWIYRPNVQSNARISFFAKANQLSQVWVNGGGGSNFAGFDLLNGTITKQGGTANPKIEEYKNGWYRCSLTSDNSGVLIATMDNNDETYIGTGKSIYLWGIQAEALTYATSYIPTNGSTQTRAAETCNGAGTSYIFESSEGILYAEIAAIADDSTLKSVCISDGSTANRVIINYSNASNRFTVDVRVGGVGQAFMQTFSFTITDFLKIALKYKLNDFALYINGSEIATDTSGSVFSAGTLNTLSFDNGAGGEDFYGKIRDIRVYNTKEMTDSEVDILLTKITS